MFGVAGADFYRSKHHLCQAEGNDIRRTFTGGYSALFDGSRTTRVKLVHIAGLAIAVLYLVNRSAYGLYDVNLTFPYLELRKIYRVWPLGLHDGRAGAKAKKT